MNKTDIKSLTHEELQDLLKGMGENRSGPDSSTGGCMKNWLLRLTK